MVRAFGVQRLGERQLERAEGRQPEEGKPGGVAQIVEVEALHEDVAAVEEPRQTQRRIAARARHRERELERAGRLAVAADRVAVEVLRPERERPVAAHRARRAGKEVLEERQGLPAEAAGEAELAARQQRERTRERVIPLVLVAEA